MSAAPTKGRSIFGGTADLVFSEDDDARTGRGWYWHAYWGDGTDGTSRRSWRTEADAIKAMNEEKVAW